MRVAIIRAVAAVMVLGLCASSLPADELWLVDFQAAKEQAAKEGKDLLMEFTGSDWCPPCIALHDKVLTKDVFREKMPEKYVLLKLDSPRDKSKQTEKEIEQYKKLSAEYKISGVPTIILADAKGRPFSKNVGYGGQEADQYVSEMVDKSKLRVARDEKFAKAENAIGAEKAKLLNEAVADFDGEMVVGIYRDIVDQIVSLDADNGLGLKSKYEGLIKVSEFRTALAEIRPTGPTDIASIPGRIDDLIHKMEPKGELLQEALVMKGNVLFGSDKEKAKEAFLAAAKAAPETPIAKQIAAFIERTFKDEPKAEKSEGEKKPAKEEKK